MNPFERLAARAAVLVGSIEPDLIDALETIKAALQPADDTPEDHALAAIETFAVVALRLMAQTSPDKVRDIARTVEIKARLDGRRVLEVAR